jgi:ankyrin repeat protein
MSNSSLNLEQQRKRAKDLRRAHRAGDINAAQRMAAVLPRARGQTPAQLLAAGITLSEAQLVVAREAGFSSWPALKHALERTTAHADSDDVLFEAALAGDAARVRAVLARRPTAARSSLALAAVLLDRAACDALLLEEPVDKNAGHRGWTPLSYVCGSRLGRGDPRADADRVHIATRLIAQGADIHTIARGPRFSDRSHDPEDWERLGEEIGMLELADGRAASAALFDLLTEAGAKATDDIVDDAVAGGELELVRRALAAAGTWYWPALVQCVQLDRPDMAELLVPHAEHARQLVPAVTAAISGGRDASFIEILLGDGSLELSRPVWQAAYGCAIRYGHSAAAARLLAISEAAPDGDPRRIDVHAVSVLDRLFGACVSGDREAQQRLSHTPGLVLARADQRMLAWAVRHGKTAAVQALLDLGLDPNVPDVDGQTPLHLAIAAQSAELTRCLLDAGAHSDVRDYTGRTPLDVAAAAGAEALTQQLLAADANALSLPDREDLVELFERAADAVAEGQLAALAALLDEEPSLVHARSPRSHRATLLHYTAANGTEDPRQVTPANAPAIARLLLERGADPNAECAMYEGGDTTLYLLLTSAFPAEAGLDGELVRELARAGADIATAPDGTGPMLCAIQNARPRSVEALIEEGVPVDNLLVAAAADRCDVVETLLAAGADIHTRFADAWTALHAAAANGRDQAAMLLLERGADPTLREERYGGVPAGNAWYNGWTALAERITAAAKGAT